MSLRPRTGLVPAGKAAEGRGTRPLCSFNASRRRFCFCFCFSILFKLKLSKVVPDKSEGCRGSGLSSLLLTTSAKESTGIRGLLAGLREALFTCRGLPPQDHSRLGLTAHSRPRGLPGKGEALPTSPPEDLRKLGCRQGPGSLAVLSHFPRGTTKAEANNVLNLTSTTCPVSHRARAGQSLNFRRCDSKVPCHLPWEALSGQSFPWAQSRPSSAVLGRLDGSNGSNDKSSPLLPHVLCAGHSANAGHARPLRSPGHWYRCPHHCPDEKQKCSVEASCPRSHSWWGAESGGTLAYHSDHRLGLLSPGQTAPSIPNTRRFSPLSWFRCFLPEMTSRARPLEPRPTPKVEGERPFPPWQPTEPHPPHQLGLSQVLRPDGDQVRAKNRLFQG